MKKQNLKVVAFDADDTLWVNEPFFRSAEAKYFEILEKYLPKGDFTKELYANEVKNLEIFGYGAKGFMLSMIETGLELTNYTMSGLDIQKLINLGKEILTYKIDCYENVEMVLKTLRGKEQLKVICITKGDLLDQESKVARSGLGDFFDEVRVVSEKDPSTYQKIIDELEVDADEFLMVGNSLKSDIVPVNQIGGHAIYIPCTGQWIHEQVDESTISNKGYIKVQSIKDVLDYI